MPGLRVMGSDPAEVRRTADAVVRALRNWPETRVGDVSETRNKQGPGIRVYIEVLADVATDGVEVTVERDEQPPKRPVRGELPPAGAGRSCS